MVLQVLYENIKDKSKVLTSKKVEKVELTENGVIVKTSDKSFYEGDILIGADGIHSTVREEMWKIGHKFTPGWFPPNEHNGEWCPENSQQSVKGLPTDILVITNRRTLRLWLYFRNFQSV